MKPLSLERNPKLIQNIPRQNHNFINLEKESFNFEILQSKNKELFDFEKDEEEQIHLAILKSLEEFNKKPEKKEKIEKFINIIEEKEEENRDEEEYDENFGICPITKDFMIHPMLAPSGNYYEKKAIIRWINEHHTDCASVPP